MWLDQAHLAGGVFDSNFLRLMELFNSRHIPLAVLRLQNAMLNYSVILKGLNLSYKALPSTLNWYRVDGNEFFLLYIQSRCYACFVILNICSVAHNAARVCQINK